MKYPTSLFPVLWAIAACASGIIAIHVGYIEYETKDVQNGTFFSKLRQLGPNEIGDALAGVFATLAFLAAAVAVLMQGRELSAQREQLRRQADEAKEMNEAIRFQISENSIFEMLRTHNEVVNSLDLYERKNNQRIAEGRDCFVVMYRYLNKQYRAKLKKHPDRVALFYAYKDLYRVHSDDLAHYFRFLYNSLRFIAETDEVIKHKYGRLFRAQLSDAEMLLLYYNCLTDFGKKFIKYTDMFEVFDNLPTVKLLNPSHSLLLPVQSFGQNPMATKSSNAQREREIIAELRGVPKK